MADLSASPWVLTLENEERVLVEKHLLVGGPYCIGRDKDCDIFVDERNVSRRHAELARDGAGAWSVRDLGSKNSNGTFVNGQRLGPEPRPLEAGDCLQVGEVLLTLHPETLGTPLPTAFTTLAGQQGGERPPRLLVVQGPEAGREIRLDRGPVTLGGGPDAKARFDDERFARVALLVRTLANGRHEIVNRGAGTLSVGLQAVEHALLSDGDLLFVEDEKREVILRLRYLGEGGQEPTCPGQPMRFLSVPPTPFGAVPPDPDTLESVLSPPVGPFPHEPGSPPGPALPPTPGHTPPSPHAPHEGAPLHAADGPSSGRPPAPAGALGALQGGWGFVTRTSEGRRWGAAGALLIILLAIGGSRIGASGGGGKAPSTGALGPDGASAPPIVAARSNEGQGGATGDSGAVHEAGASGEGAAASGFDTGAAGHKDEAALASAGAPGGRRPAKVPGTAGRTNGGIRVAPGEVDAALRARLEQRVFGTSVATPAEVDALMLICQRQRDRACIERVRTILAKRRSGL